MYVVLLHYTAPEHQVDEALPEHSHWVSRHYDAGDFIVAGRRQNHDGAVIIARAMSRGQLDAILATDPFATRHLVRHEVIEFNVKRTIPELVKYADAVSTGQE